MTHAQPSQTNSTYGDGLSVAFELVATPAVFGLMGFGLDRWLGTTPLFVLAFTLLSLGTVIGLTIWRYGLEMDRADTERRQARSANGVRRARWERDPGPTDPLPADPLPADPLPATAAGEPAGRRAEEVSW